jgi:hypothetical protein
MQAGNDVRERCVRPSAALRSLKVRIGVRIVSARFLQRRVPDSRGRSAHEPGYDDEPEHREPGGDQAASEYPYADASLAGSR